MRTALLLLVGAAAGVLGYRAYDWKHYTDMRSYYSTQSASYLFAPSGVVNTKGEPLSRQQLLDFMLHDIVQNNPQLGLQFANK